MLLTRSILKLNNVPFPFRGVTASLTKAETRRAIMVPGPVLMILAEMDQLLAVSPAGSTNGVEKLTTAES